MASPTLNGIGVGFARLTLPRFKRWHLDVRLMGGLEDTSGTQTFTFANVTYIGSIFRTKEEAGARAMRIVGGTGGLSNVLPAKGYAQTNPVLLSLVLGDLARETGETIVVDTDRSLGYAYVRAQMPASRTLDILTGGQWWMAANGTIHTDPNTRDLTPIASNYMATRWRGAQGVYLVIPDAPGDWTPGRTFANTSVSGIISRCELDISAQKLEARVMTGDADTDRLQDPVSAIVSEVESALLYHLTWPFTVNSVSPGPPVTMQLISNDSRMPNINNVTLWPGPSGAWATPPNGAAVRVRFVAADPSQPEIVALDPANAPTTVTVAGGGPAVARVGDQIKITNLQFTTAGTQAGGNNVTNTIGDLIGTISSGSAKVTIG